MAKKPTYDPNAAFMSIIGRGGSDKEEATLPVAQEAPEPEVAPISETPKAEQATEAPKKKGRPKMQRETKKRMSFTILPSLHEQASEIAYREGKSMSELVSELLTEYVEKNR